MKILLNFSLILIAILLISCGSNHNNEIGATAWSDDSSKIAFTTFHYDQNNCFVFNCGIDNENFSLGVVDRNGESKKYIMENVEADLNGMIWGNPELYFKSNLDYFLVRTGNSGRVSDGNSPIDYDVDYKIFDSNGAVLHEISKNPGNYCDSYIGFLPAILLLPSPSGELIAKAETNVNCTFQIDIMSFSNNLNIIDTGEIEGLELVGMFWVDEEYLLLSTCIQFPCNGNWFLLQIGEGTKYLSEDQFFSLCLDGVSIASNINSLNEKIVWEDEDDRLSIEMNKFELNDGFNWSRQISNRILDNPNDCTKVDDI